MPAKIVFFSNFYLYIFFNINNLFLFSQNLLCKKKIKYNKIILFVIFKKFMVNKNIDVKDCGSIEFQILQLSDEIKKLTEHLKKFKKDNHSKYGLIKKVSRRKVFLKYLGCKGKKIDKIGI